MKELVKNQIWSAESSLWFTMFRIKSRMTAIRLSNGKLWLPSPIRLRDVGASVLSALGEVAYIVAPNFAHHRFVGDYVKEFPNARLYGVEALLNKRRDLRFSGTLGTGTRLGWHEDIDQTLFLGLRHMEEAIFYHRHTGTLLITDLFVQFRTSAGPIGRLASRVMGTYDKPAMTPVMRKLIDDRKAARRCAERILEWDVRRVLTCHGDLLEGDGNTIVKDAFGWLLD